MSYGPTRKPRPSRLGEFTNPEDIRRRIALQDEQSALTEAETYFDPVVEHLGEQVPVAVPPDSIEW
jgi:hypothetical protein